MPRVKKCLVLTVAITAVALGVAAAVDKRPDSSGPGASSKELVEAARRAYELRAQAFLNSEVRGLDEAYVWSKRWMTAEWDLRLSEGKGDKGVRAHHDRMVELERVARRMHETGQGSEFDAAAATYYRIEAELMLARAGR